MKTNKLINEKSPYLLQHAGNPVEWYPWGSEAFEKACSENKPMFLSIGYSTCHWCHVMAHDSFESEEIAKLLNDGYVAVKVDREERPDIDAVYMSVCQAMNGSGGWPLTIIMTPDAKPFFAATYLPSKSRRGLIGLSEILESVSEKWEENSEELIAVGNKVQSLLANHMTEIDMHEDNSTDKISILLNEAFENYKENFDDTYGGFGRAPKFPAPHNLLFLMQYARVNTAAAPDCIAMVKKTLLSMIRGGIFDHIGGGFSRYSTDAKWLLPHFEKMLYDNALLLWALAEAFLLPDVGNSGASVLSTDVPGGNPGASVLFTDVPGGNSGASALSTDVPGSNFGMSVLSTDVPGGNPGVSALSTDVPAGDIPPTGTQSPDIFYPLRPAADISDIDSTASSHACLSSSAAPASDAQIYRKAAELTLSYIFNELTNKDGAFFCGQDADSEGVEGRFYTLSPNEVDKVLRKSCADDYCIDFGITKNGILDGKSIPNLLHNSNWRQIFLAPKTEIIRKKLSAYRRKRYPLHTDDKVLFSWNCLMILALVYASQAFAEAAAPQSVSQSVGQSAGIPPESRTSVEASDNSDRPAVLSSSVLLQTAIRTESFLYERMSQNNSLRISYRNGYVYGNGKLDDYAYGIAALTALYTATDDISYFKKSEELCTTTIENFFDEKNGGFYMYSIKDEQLIFRPKETYDGAMPSGNSMMLYALEKLSRISSNRKIQEAYSKQLNFMFSAAAPYPGTCSFALIALINSTVNESKCGPEGCTL